MHPLRQKLARNPAIKFFSSVKIAVVCLGLLIILTFWGTVDQVNNGLYLAQEKFFHSIFFLAFGFLPFPGARLVLWVLFINLTCAAITRLVFRLSHIGIVIIHIGLLLYFVAAFITFHVVQESNLSLYEGEASNVSSAYHDWELSVWKKDDGRGKNIVAYSVDKDSAGNTLAFDEFGLSVEVNKYFPNALAYINPQEAQGEPWLNDSGIKSVTPKPIEKERERNIPAATFNVTTSNAKALPLLLYGAESKPTTLDINGEAVNFQLRRKRSRLPFLLKLKEFKKDLHPNTENASSYQSLVEIIFPKASREVLISMNEPLRYKSYTLYQASYSIDQLGRERSTLAVVKNSGRLMPYVASLATFAGLLIHFLMMAIGRQQR